MKRNILLFAAFTAVFSAFGAEPAGYYSKCQGLKGQQLLKALETVISSHHEVGYNGLWTLYRESDADASGKIIDIYSTKRWTYRSEQCGNYSSVGDCYNREHSMPKSWFNDQTPMYDDAYHLYPTDGKVNNQRSNYPYGECASGTRLPSHGGVQALGKLGKCTFPGYSGTVFEPDDQYKGDLARSYFYMAACYNSRIASWDSPMLAGNSFPAFSSWALNLLLKWHREDPVSDKERSRNEAVADAQRNRNPFIDHPELAEHIWGNLSSTGWGSDPVPDASFTSPANGSTVDMGTVATGKRAQTTVSVRGTGFTQSVSVSISGTGFSVSPATLTAAQVNAGATVTVSLTPTKAGACSGTLKLASGNASVTVTVKANALSGIPAGQAENVTSHSFTAVWVSTATSASATYQLHVTDASGSNLAGYPATVKAADGRHEVTGLEPSTRYRYWLSDGTQNSNTVEVTTRALTPELYLEPENDLAFRTVPGTPSDAVMIFIDAYNVDGDITVGVTAPFELSANRKSWSPTLTLSEDEGQFYLRLNGSNAGTFRTSVTATATDCRNDDLTAEGVIESPEPVRESFEAEANFGYSGTSRQGDVARWDFSGAGVFDDSRDVHSGRQGVRFNTSEGGYVLMTDAMAGGIESVTFHTRLWDSAAARVTLDYSLDGGASWTTAATVSPRSEWTATTARLDAPGAVKLRITKPEGARVALDDIEITPIVSGLTPGERTYSWDATATAEGVAVSNLTGETRRLALYDLDGRCLWNAVMPAGTVVIALPRGHYIAVSGDESRRVVVR